MYTFAPAEAIPIPDAARGGKMNRKNFQKWLAVLCTFTYNIHIFHNSVKLFTWNYIGETHTGSVFQVKLDGWKQLFESKILRRGESYFHTGAVESLEYDGESITAVVYGTEDYDVEISLSGGQVEEMYCSCPYAERGNCKHMAAVLFAASADSFPDSGSVSKWKTVSDRGESVEIPLDEAVKSLKETDARELLLQFARKYSDLAEQIMLKTAGRITDGQIRAWEKQIAGLSRQYADRYGYIDYRHASAYTSEMESLLDEKIPILLDCGLPMEAFGLTCKVLEKASSVQMDDSDGGLGALIWNCMEHWNDILTHMNMEERHRMFDWFQENYRRWDVADDIFDEFMFGGSQSDRAFEEPEFLRRKLELLDGQLAKAKEKEDRYDLDRFSAYRVETMEKLSMDREEIEAYLREHREIRSIRERMINRALQESRYDDAIALLRESKEIDGKYHGYLSKDSRKLVELYRKTDRVEDLRSELMFQMEQISQDDLQYVNMLKEITPPEQWPELRERLLSLKNLSWLRGAFLEQECLYDRLLEYVMKHGSIRIMDHFANTLKEKYPDEVLKFYLSCLRREMERASSRTEYAEQVQRLKNLEHLSGGKEAAVKLAEEWRAAYPRRRAMIEEMQKAGF